MWQRYEIDDPLREECLNYFVSVPILKKLLYGFYEKYRSFGVACGKVTLRNLDQESVEILEGFTGNNYHGKRSATLSAERVQQILDRSRFGGVGLEELVKELAEGELKSKKQEQAEAQEQFYEFCGECLYGIEDTTAGQWMRRALAEHSREETLIRRRYREELRYWEELQEGAKNQSHEKYDRLYREWQILLNALNHLPVFQKSWEYLPAFAARYSGDPHHFDEGKPDTTLFYRAVQAILGRGQKTDRVMNAEQKHQLLFEAGLIRDSLSNDAMVYGIRGISAGREHLGMKGFYEQEEPYSLTLSTIMKLDTVSCRDNCLFAVENPIVFAKLIEDVRISAVCVNGQPDFAVLLLLDRVAAGGAEICYNGDFDPEGLLIAQRLKNRYQERLTLWHYTDEDYELALSEKEVSEARLRMLDGLTAPELLRIADRMRTERRAGYQERIFC